MTKKLICYCSGGLGNRLRPLSSAVSIAKNLNRELLVWWQPEVCCQGTFNDLFMNQLSFIDHNEFVALGFPRIYEPEQSLVELVHRMNSLVYHPLNIKQHEINLKWENFWEDKETLLLFSNNFYNRFIDDKQFILDLIPTKPIENKINLIQNTLNIDKSVIGVHARGTDFGNTVTYYLNQIADRLKSNKNTKFFIASDDSIYKQTIRNHFSDSNILMQEMQLPEMNDHNLNSWKHPNNIHANIKITVPTMMDGVVDIYLLSLTNFQIYDSRSSYANIAKILCDNKYIQ